MYGRKSRDGTGGTSLWRTTGTFGSVVRRTSTLAPSNGVRQRRAGTDGSGKVGVRGANVELRGVTGISLLPLFSDGVRTGEEVGTVSRFPISVGTTCPAVGGREKGRRQGVPPRRGASLPAESPRPALLPHTCRKRVVSDTPSGHLFRDPSVKTGFWQELCLGTV